jgi:hypothetical protein
MIGPMFMRTKIFDRQKNGTYSCCKVVSFAMLGDKTPVNPDEDKLLQSQK